jgi:GNAT superfamily N-acetyltransferase
VIIDTIIQNVELKRWLKEHPSCKEYLSQGYREAITDIQKNVFSDPRASINEHVINPDFKINPRYFFSFRTHQNQPLLVICCLYVFPSHRGCGHGTHMLNQVKGMVRDQGVAQVAVEGSKVAKLTDFYLRHGFKTTGVMHTNDLGQSYVDFFWSGKNYNLINGDNQTILEPL